MTYEEIEQLKKEEFADIVKRNIREKAFDDLMNTKKSHTKLDNRTRDWITRHGVAVSVVRTQPRLTGTET